MSTDKLKIYNGALLNCQERALASLTENREPRFLLDGVWDDGGVRYCLENGQWQFAMRSQKLDFSPSIQPSFGYRRAFNKPSDWVLTCAVCEDEWYQTPLLQYTDEVGFWFSDRDVIYVRYVSDDVQFGMNLSLWPTSFTEYVKAHFAEKIVAKLQGASENKVRMVIQQAERARKIALNKDAFAEPTRFPPSGSWTTARSQGTATRRDRGSRNNLIG